MPKNPVVASYVADFLKLDQLHVYRQITGLRHELDAHVFTHKREYPEHFPYHEKWLHVLPRPRTRWLRRLIHTQLRNEPWQIYRWELRRWILDLARIDAQLLHIYFGHVAPQFIPLMKVWPKPIVVSFHGADAGGYLDQPKYLAAMQEVFRLATKIQSRSEALNADLIKLGCPPEKVVLQRTGVPMEDWPLREREAPADGAWHLMQSCRFIEKKGLDLTMQTFANVVQKYPRARLTLVGDGPLRPLLEQQARDLGLAEKVAFTGFAAHGTLARVLYDAQIYLHPSRTGSDGNREGVPNAMLEAMTTGIPVVATRHGGIPEAITDGENGLLVDENDVEGLTRATLRLIEEPGLRQRIGLGGREAVGRKYDRAAQDRELISFYKGLMQSREL